MRRTFLVLVCTVFFGVMFQGIVSVLADVHLPEIALYAKAWKEILLVVALAVLACILTVERRWDIVRSKYVYIPMAFAFGEALYGLFFQTGILPYVAGLVIDLRYILLFVLIYISMRLYPESRRLLVNVFAAGAGIVIGFAILQIFVLPADILAAIGYSKATIAPYLTVDQNEAFVRINSTLRGPNPIGAFALIASSLAFVGAVAVKNKRYTYITAGILSLIVVWCSYSRSALAGLVVALGIIAVYFGYARFGRRIYVWVIGALVGLVALGGIFMMTPAGSIILGHEDPGESGQINSNDGHAVSLREGIAQMLREPFGAGVGSVGSPSLLGEKPVIIESQYLYVAHQIGWLGLVAYCGVCFLVLEALWRSRQSLLGIGVFASGIGLCIIGLVLPVWVDDTVALVWWGLAAIVIGGHHGYTINKKTA